MYDYVLAILMRSPHSKNGRAWLASRLRWIAHLESENFKKLPFKELFVVPFQFAYNVDHPGIGKRAEPERGGNGLIIV